jgi:ATP-binding protein involved in chromosome partitioning
MGASLVGQVIVALKTVVDPETSRDVWDMRLIRDIQVGEDGDVSLTFRPSSVVCPLAFTLAPRIKKAVQAVEGVRRVKINVEGFLQAERLNQLLESMDERGR